MKREGPRLFPFFFRLVLRCIFLPFAPATAGRLLHPRNVVVLALGLPPFALVRLRNVFGFEFLFFAPAAAGRPIWSRLGLVQSSRLGWVRVVCFQ